MTLATHAVIGAAVAQFFPESPILGFFAGFASHFFADAIPHGHYKLRSKRYLPASCLEEDMIVRSKEFRFDITRVGCDFAVGIILSFLIFESSLSIDSFLLGGAFWGAIGGVLPDPLQFAYWKIRSEPLVSLQKFHIWMHSKTRFDNNHAIAIAIESTIVLLIYFLKNITI